MARFRMRLAIVIAITLAACLAISTHHTVDAVAFAQPGEDIEKYPVDLGSDFEDAEGTYHTMADPKNVDEFNNYVDTSSSPDQETFAGIEVSSEESKSFFLSLAMIVVSEIGDKTFLIAAIMAMKHPRLLVFSAAISALAIMTFLSAAFGHAVPNLIPRTYTNYLAAILFFCFGIRMFYDGYHMTEEDAKHELEEVTQELQDKEDLEMLQRAEAGSAADSEANMDENSGDTSGLVDRSSAPHSKNEASGVVNLFQLLFSPVFVQTFVMTFLAEWGDRSQIATIALAAAHNMIWVSIGGVFGHSLCTGVAVIGGRMLASRISVRTVTLAGAIVFEIFAVVSLYEAIHEA
ncbi:hypothetical protein EC957_003888 [Mortierella hygrophila]|uniref:GDT1 family protein n=1 Tax=Mortierella hygrophila TaxID=979708 RepID=A0A9P6F1G0_9FUNG|nr:hypothetical protein EC957_003888 [Mortierella hygrophila]